MPYTPGPWHANAILKNRIVGDETSPKFDKIQINNSNCTIATVYRSSDARLISAAPDLLKSCKAALWSLGCYIEKYPDGLPETPTMEELRAAIAKAEGK